MENLYPKFERNRILKKEQLMAIRDRCFGYLETEYLEYGEGIVTGCRIQVEGYELVVGPGMLKCGEFIYLLEEERIGYEPKEGVQYLKLRRKGEKDLPDGAVYEMGLVLEMSGSREEYEYELCRFHLREGARLRQEYTDFYDMGTEYDTVNVIHGSWSGLGGKGIAPSVTRQFAEELLRRERLEAEDYGFACQCLCQRGAMPLKVVETYIQRRTGEASAGRQRVYEMLCRILEEAGGTRRRTGGSGKGRRQILVD